MRASDRMATGTIGGHTASFLAAHRDDNETSTALTLTIALPMSLDDVTAALWILVKGGFTMADLDDPALIHEMVLETVLAEGALDLATARDEIREMTTTSAEATVIAQLRELVTSLYGQDVPGPRRTARQKLVGVAR